MSVLNLSSSCGSGDMLSGATVGKCQRLPVENKMMAPSIAKWMICFCKKVSISEIAPPSAKVATSLDKITQLLLICKSCN